MRLAGATRRWHGGRGYLLAVAHGYQLSGLRSGGAARAETKVRFSFFFPISLHGLKSICRARLWIAEVKSRFEGNDLKGFIKALKMLGFDLVAEVTRTDWSAFGRSLIAQL